MRLCPRASTIATLRGRLPFREKATPTSVAIQILPANVSNSMASHHHHQIVLHHIGGGGFVAVGNDGHTHHGPLDVVVARLIESGHAADAPAVMLDGATGEVLAAHHLPKAFSEALGSKHSRH